MNIKTDYKTIDGESVAKGTVVTIGNFDGVHLGHQTIIDNCLAQSAQRDLHCIICTFEPHPVELFSPSDIPKRLTTPARKQSLLLQMAPHILLCQKFDREFASLSPEQFVNEALCNAMNAKIVVVGENFRFGKNRSGDIQFLKNAGKHLGFEVLAENLLSFPNAVISSTRIRNLVQEGNVKAAYGLLNRYHELPGTIVEGHQVGRTLGFPTINIHPQKVICPGDGIYSAYVEIAGEKRCKAAVYIGDRPTLAHGHSIEAFLLDFDKTVYGKEVILYFVSKIRDNIKFANIDELKTQITTDILQIRKELEQDT